MKPLPTQARALLKRQAILDAAKAEFTDTDYEQTTAKSITARAGVAVGTFYQYFSNKQEVLLLLTQARFDYLHQTMVRPDIKTKGRPNNKQVRALFNSVLQLIYDFHAADPAFHQVLEHRRSQDPQLDKVIEQGEAVLLSYTLEFVRLLNDKNPEPLAFCVFAMAEGLVHRHVFSHSKVSRDEVIKLGVDLLARYFEK